MAVEGRINVRHEEVLTESVLVLSVDPVEDFDKQRAGVEDPQEKDKTTGMRLWSVSVLDPPPSRGAERSRSRSRPMTVPRAG